jgi:hypothetical protein
MCELVVRQQMTGYPGRSEERVNTHHIRIQALLIDARRRPEHC